MKIVTSELVLHFLLAFALLAAYLILTLTGHDADLIAGVFVGQLSALGIQKATTNTPPSPERDDAAGSD